jgi:hypothetical protein
MDGKLVNQVAYYTRKGDEIKIDRTDPAQK